MNFFSSGVLKSLMILAVMAVFLLLQGCQDDKSESSTGSSTGAMTEDGSDKDDGEAEDDEDKDECNHEEDDEENEDEEAEDDCGDDEDEDDCDDDEDEYEDGENSDN